MADNFKRIDTTALYAPFFVKLQRLVFDCEALGFRYVATSGLRTFAEQTKLFEQGRTTPGQIVTQARAGESPHNYGIAVDFVRDLNPATAGVEPSWANVDYETLAVAAEKIGLEAGAHWPKFKDYPHIQLPIQARGLTWSGLKASAEAGTLTATLDAIAW